MKWKARVLAAIALAALAAVSTAGTKKYKYINTAGTTVVEIGGASRVDIAPATADVTVLFWPGYTGAAEDSVVIRAGDVKESFGPVDSIKVIHPVAPACDIYWE